MDRVENFVLSGGVFGALTINNRCLPLQGYLDVELKVNNGITEIPDFMISSVRDYVLGGYGLISIGLGKHPRTTQRRLVRGALSDFSSAYRYHWAVGVTMSSGATYYGLPGMIFDADFNPLLMMTSSVENVDIDGTIRMYIIKHNCRVSPAVFQNQDRLIEKTIIKKIIPFCASHEVTWNDYISVHRVNMEKAYPAMDIIISNDISDMFIRRIVVPDVNTVTRENTHNILATHRQEIVDDN